MISRLIWSLFEDIQPKNNNKYSCNQDYGDNNYYTFFAHATLLLFHCRLQIFVTHLKVFIGLPDIVSCLFDLQTLNMHQLLYVFH